MGSIKDTLEVADLVAGVCVQGSVTIPGTGNTSGWAGSGEGTTGPFDFIIHDDSTGISF